MIICDMRKMIIFFPKSQHFLLMFMKCTFKDVFNLELRIIEMITNPGIRELLSLTNSSLDCEQAGCGEFQKVH